MGGVCPSRKAQETCSTPSSSPPAVDKVILSSPISLPVKSWRARLEEADSKSDTKPRTHLVPAPKDIGPILNAKRSFRNTHAPGSAVGALDELLPSAVGIGNGSKLKIQTGTYLQLLNEGGPKKKPPSRSFAARSNTTVHVATAQGACLGPTTMTGATLKQAWQSTLRTPSLEGQQAPKPKLVQDDILVEKMHPDCDITDPTYWSDTDSVDKSKNNASAHSLGRSVKRHVLRSYVMQDISFDIDKAVGVMISRLEQLNKQQKIITQDGGGQQQRRFVIGLKEVIRRVRHQPVACVIIPPDLESDLAEGGLDDRVREVIAVCHEKNIPVIFALSRSRLGQAMDRSMMVSVLGILDTTGAQDLLNNASELSRDACHAWLARLPNK